MPLYEEKLLSPFAIRFTQGGIRNTFRDGREVEASRAEITARPGSGDYDLILDAPFPAIEIIRWAPRHCSAEAGSEQSTTDEEDEREKASEQWFTYDNRRLYCLQRAAAEQWPKRVAAVVQVMYASDAHALRRKFDTASGGRGVTVCRHVHSIEAPLFAWTWRRGVSEHEEEADEEAVRAARRAVSAEERKARVEDLQDAPPATGTELLACAAATSALERLEAQLVHEAQLAEAARSQQPAGEKAEGAKGASAGRHRRRPRRGGGQREVAAEEAPKREAVLEEAPAASGAGRAQPRRRHRHPRSRPAPAAA